MKARRHTSGFSLVETLVATAIFLLVSVAVYEAHSIVFKLVSLNRAKTAALALAEERIEVVRNMPYADIGIVDGVPAGAIERSQSFDRAGFMFFATTTVRNIDDPFDGQIGSTTKNDLSPADYKLVEIDIDCPACKDFSPFTVTTTAAPKSLETSSGNGALFVRIINASGLPVPDASISIEGQGTSTIDIDELSNNEGLLQIVDIPPGSFLYRITASKSGFSADRTYPLLDAANPNPVLPDSTVAAGSVTQLTLAIDELGSMDIRTVDETCAPVSAVPFTIRGSKKIGIGPDVYKVDASYTTNGAGERSLSSIEWDTYSIALGTGYVSGGSVPLIPLSLDPGAHEDVILLAKSPVGRSILVTVKDASTGLPLSDATVEVTGSTVNETVVTNKGFLRQTDWSGGAGQDIFSDEDSFSSSDGGVESSATPGQVELKRFFGEYLASGELVSSWFDVGSSTTLHSIEWQPLSQATSTSVMFQLEGADNIASTTTGFIGPDGTPSSFYTATMTAVNPIHTNKRFVRYKMLLSTASASSTPIVSDVSITFGTECLPHGQAYFDGLSSETYTVDVGKSGYDSWNGTVDASLSAENTLEVLLNEL